MFLSKVRLSPHGGGGFHAPPPSSRPPTKTYDRQSYVLVVDESDDVLKFMKMHLNRYFSHVVVAKSAADGVQFLKQKDFDLIITDAVPTKKMNAELLKKIASHWRKIPVILTETQEAPECKPEDFPQLVVIDVIRKPPDLDTFHVAIRRALNIRKQLDELNNLLPPKSQFGSVVRSAPLAAVGDKVKALITEVRKKLTEEITD